MLPKQQFDKDEKVLCFHGELLYEAKILEVEQDSSTAPFRYRIHYKGWKNTWDDWVENDRLRKLNDENREIAQALKRQYLESVQKPTKPTTSKRKGLPSDFGSTRGSEERYASAPATGRGQKRGRNADLEEVGDPVFVFPGSSHPKDPGLPAAPECRYAVEAPRTKAREVQFTSLEKAMLTTLARKQEETFQNRPMIKIPIPDYIKSLLVDDWEEVTKNLALVPLPSQKPVNTILDEYFEEEKEKRFPGSADMDLLEEVVAGMKEYFDVALGRMLLYRFERQQYADVIKHWAGGKGEWKGKSCPGDTYGAEHLCRMLVNLPEIVAQTNMDAQSINRLREEMIKFLRWLSKNTKIYFLAGYEPANQDYIEKTRAN
ncbi:MAG: hypothetical protein LQ348_007656 [Seirophora lacunosa]|nr:MAG: hypothetical protein LQ348_007656 [Seirophora lacunosa]